jgi:chorismate-pyruvate lyase
VKQTRRATPDLENLLDLFYQQSDKLGRFEEITEAEMPEVYRGLLAHDKHMTVTVEAFHGCSVDVRVLDTHVTSTHYSRKILLTRQSDGAVVQYGIVRLNLDYLNEDARREIESQRTPLGRVLIKHNVLRTVRLLALWKIEPGEELRKLFGLEEAAACFGRTALIYCNGIPAVELLEIVTPA